MVKTFCCNIDCWSDIAIKKVIKTDSLGLKKCRSQSKVDSESFRQSLIIKFLVTLPNSRLIRLYNCPPFDSKKGKFIRRSTALTPPGLPDLLFISKELGCHFFEVKSEKAYKVVLGRYDRLKGQFNDLESYRHLQDQVRLVEEFNAYGCVHAHFVSTVDHVRSALCI